MSNQNLNLSDDTLQFIMKSNNITKEQAKDLWTLSLSFNDILVKKYGVNNYCANANEIASKMKKYQLKLVERYKNENKMNEENKIENEAEKKAKQNLKKEENEALLTVNLEMQINFSELSKLQLQALRQQVLNQIAEEERVRG